MVVFPVGKERVSVCASPCMDRFKLMDHSVILFWCTTQCHQNKAKNAETKKLQFFWGSLGYCIFLSLLEVGESLFGPGKEVVLLIFNFIEFLAFCRTYVIEHPSLIINIGISD
jgi:hypothetical protein